MRTIIIIALSFLEGFAHAESLSAWGADGSNLNQSLPPDIIRWALAQVESGHLKNPDLAKGRSGEISRFQIMPEIWKDYTRSRNFKNPSIAWTVALRILQDRYSWFLKSTKREPSAFDLYVMWNRPGLYERVEFDPDRLPRRVRDVAARFENLVEVSQAQRSLAIETN